MALDCDLTALHDQRKSTVPSISCAPSHPSSSMKIHPGICWNVLALPRAAFLHHSLTLTINIPNFSFLKGHCGQVFLHTIGSSCPFNALYLAVWTFCIHCLACSIIVTFRGKVNDGKSSSRACSKIWCCPSPLAGFMLVLHTNSISSLGTNHMNTASWVFILPRHRSSLIPRWKSF